MSLVQTPQEIPLLDILRRSGAVTFERYMALCLYHPEYGYYMRGHERTVGTFPVHIPKVIALTPPAAPIGTLLRISGEHFGFYSESGATPYAFTDFNTGENRVDIGGVRAVIYRWQDDRIDVWVPFSAKSGPVVMYRGATKPNSDGSCCATKETLKTEAGVFTLVTPKVDSYSPQSGGLDELITIKGSGFGSFLKTATPMMRREK